MKTKKLHMSWVICAVCTFMIMCTVGFTSTSFSVYLPFIRSAYGFTNSQTSLVMTTRYISSIIAMFKADEMIEKFGAKKCAVVSLFVEAIGFAMYAFAKSLSILVLASFVAGFAYGFGGMVLVSIIIAKWFVSKKATALSICAAGTGVSGIFIPPIVTKIVKSMSLPIAFFIETGVILLCLLSVLVILKDSPEQIGLKPYITGDVEESKKKAFGAPLPKTVYIVVVIATFALGATTNTAAGFATMFYTQAGYTEEIVSLLFSAGSFMLILGKFLYGILADAIGPYIVNYVYFLSTATGLTFDLLAVTGHPIFAWPGRLLVGFGNSLATVGITANATAFANEKTFPRTMRVFQISYTLGMMAFSYIPGVLADLLGNYNLAIIIAVVFILFYGAVSQYAYKKYSLNR